MKAFVRPLAAAGALAALAALVAAAPAALPASGGPNRIVATTPAGLRAWDARLDQAAREGDLRVIRRDEDTLIAGRVHERLAQYYEDVPVVGGDLARQLDGGVTTSIFGTVYTGIDLDSTPGIPAAEAAAAAQRITGGRLRGVPTLVVLPLDAGGYTLAWRATVWTGDDLVALFVDASDGEVVLRYSDLRTQAPPQAATGTGTGVLGDQKKVDASAGAGGYLALDRLRPASLSTYHVRGNVERLDAIIEGTDSLSDPDIAFSVDNVWTDGPVVDAHYYSGRTYDYFHTRFGRRGLDDANRAVSLVVHPVARGAYEPESAKRGVFFTGAFYAGDGLVVLGEGLPAGLTADGRSWTYAAAALDIVAHELAHGVVQYTSNLLYRNEPGALAEAFCDIMATGVEFFAQPEGAGPMKADYLHGEDAAGGGVRSLADPASKGHPDHYSKFLAGTSDNGYVHANSLIASHAYYLAVEGGTNATSGASVTGVGRANREQMEKVFYRAFAYLMPSSATFSTARAATIQAAADLYGAGSAAERAVSQAWAAVGVE